MSFKLLKIPDRILIMQLRHVGEILFITPLIRQIKSSWPSVKIDWLIENSFLCMIENHPLINEKIVAGYTDFSSYTKLAEKLRSNHYDLIINFHRGEDLSLLAVLAKPEYIAGRSSLLFSPYVNFKFNSRHNAHTIDTQLNNIEKLGVNVREKTGLELFLPPDAIKNVDELWHDHNLTGYNVIGINPGASWETKRICPSVLRGLCKLLIADGYKPVIFGGDNDVKAADDINMSLDIPSFAGKLSLLESAAAISRCRAFISGDSGPLHIAVSQNIPSVAVYGPTNPAVYAPYLVKSEILISNACVKAGNCILKKCHAKCIKSFTENQLLDAVKKVLISDC